MEKSALITCEILSCKSARDIILGARTHIHTHTLSRHASCKIYGPESVCGLKCVKSKISTPYRRDWKIFSCAIYFQTFRGYNQGGVAVVTCVSSPELISIFI